MHKKEQEKNKLVGLSFWVENYLYRTEKDLSLLTQNLSVYNPKNCYQALRNMGWIREKLISDPRPRGQKSTGSRIRIRNTVGKPYSPLPLTGRKLHLSTSCATPISQFYSQVGFA
jgi:hypothetical protein